MNPENVREKKKFELTGGSMWRHNGQKTYRCYSLWDPHSTWNIKVLETVQRQAVHEAQHHYCQTYSMDQVIQTLDWPFLQEWRRRYWLHNFCKFHHNLIRALTDQTSHEQSEDAATLFDNVELSISKSAFFPHSMICWLEQPTHWPWHPSSHNCPMSQTFLSWKCFFLSFPSPPQLPPFFLFVCFTTHTVLESSKCSIWTL